MSRALLRTVQSISSCLANRSAFFDRCKASILRVRGHRIGVKASEGAVHLMAKAERRQGLPESDSIEAKPRRDLVARSKSPRRCAGIIVRPEFLLDLAHFAMMSGFLMSCPKRHKGYA